MINKDPIKVVENFIELYGYDYIYIIKTSEDNYRIFSVNEMPETLYLLIQDEYHIMGAGQNFHPFTGDLRPGYFINFSEFPHISKEM